MVLKLFQRPLKTVTTRFTTTIKINENLALQSSQYADKIAVMCPSHFCQSHKPLESESSKIFSSQSHDLVESSQSRVTRTVESLRVIGLQARVNVNSHELSCFFYNIFLL